MSILIRGMKMPTNCYVCPFCDYVSARCDAVKGTPYTPPNRYEVTAEWCPLIELPPHGRLIDADALIARIRRAKELQPELSDLYENEALEMLLWVGTEPTIIEAENPFFESLKRGLEQALNGEVRETTITDVDMGVSDEKTVGMSEEKLSE